MSTGPRENWGKEYVNKTVTYAASPRNPSDLEQLWHYEVVRGYVTTHLPDVKDPKIIEVGCGGARNALYLAMHGYDVSCADYSEEAIRLARANFETLGAHGTFLLDDLMKSTIPDETFDCVMSFGLLEHFVDLDPLVQSLTRLIKPGGLHIHVVVPKKFSTQTIVDVLMFPFKLAINLFVRRLPIRGIVKRSYRNFPFYENSYSWQQYCAAFAKGGNEVLNCEAGSLILSLFYWPTHVGLGYPAMKLYAGLMERVNNWVRDSKSPAVYRFSQTFTIIGRKK